MELQVRLETHAKAINEQKRKLQDQTNEVLSSRNLQVLLADIRGTLLRLSEQTADGGADDDILAEVKLRFELRNRNFDEHGFPLARGRRAKDDSVTTRAAVAGRAWNNAATGPDSVKSKNKRSN